MDTDWQMKLPTLLQRINHILEFNLFCDCEFTVGDKKIKCHKLLLAVSSPVFQAMFYGSLSLNEDLYVTTLITDINFDIFQQMIHYIYTNEVKLSSCKNASNLYLAAKKYMLQDLVKICLNYLMEHIDCNNVLLVYEFAKFHSEDSLLKSCIKEIQVNTSKVLNSETLIDISISTFNVILDMKRLNLFSELELVNAVERWVHANNEKKGYDNASNVAKVLIQKLRFLTLTMDEFISGPANSEILNDTEKLEILLRIIRPELPPMKNKLCDKKIKRKQLKVKCLARLDIQEIHQARCDGTEWLTSIFTINSRIDLLGVQVHLQINRTDDYYMENIMVKVSLASEREYFAEGHLKEKVSYNSKAEIMFNNITTLEPFKEYAIHVFLCSVGLYPLGRHSNLACDNQTVEIEFVSHSSWERSHPCNTTVLNAIIYSDPLD